MGHSLLASALAILLPFVALAGLAAPHVRPANWVVVEWGDVDWGTFINGGCLPGCDCLPPTMSDL